MNTVVLVESDRQRAERVAHQVGLIVNSALQAVGELAALAARETDPIVARTIWQGAFLLEERAQDAQTQCAQRVDALQES